MHGHAIIANEPGAALVCARQTHKDAVAIPPGQPIFIGHKIRSLFGDDRRFSVLVAIAADEAAEGGQ